MINLLVVVQSKHSVVVAKIELRGNKMSFNILNSARSYESHTDTQSSPAGRRLRQTGRLTVK